MDQLDEKIILDLESRGVQKYSAMAAQYGVSERTVRRRINNIFSAGLVRKIVVPNLVLLGFRAWARIGIKVSPGSFLSVARKLVSNPSVYFAAATLGRFDIMIAVFFDTIDKLADFVNSELTKINGIRAAETFLLVHPRKYNFLSWPKPILKRNKSFYDLANLDSFHYERYEMDNTERIILEHLLKEGPAQPKDLSRELGLGENTVRKRLKAMQAKGLFRVEVIPITRELEYGARATIGVTVSIPDPHRIIDSIIEHPAVSIASVALGRHNIILVTRFRNTNFLDQFVTEFLAPIPGVASVETFLHVRRLKYFNITWPID